MDVYQSYDDLSRRVVPLKLPDKWNINMTQNVHIFLEDNDYKIEKKLSFTARHLSSDHET